MTHLVGIREIFHSNSGGASLGLPEILVVFVIRSCGNPRIRHACFGLPSSLHTSNVLQYGVYSKCHVNLNLRFSEGSKTLHKL